MNVSWLQECSRETIQGTFVGDVPCIACRKCADVKYFDEWIANK